MKTISCFVALLLTTSVGASQQRWHYPPAPRADVADNYFGRAVADPYRPLEDLDAPATTAWVDAENAVTFAYLGGIAMRDSIRARLTALWNYPRVGVPSREAGQLWFRKNSGLQKQSVLYRATSPGATPVAVLDPNSLSPDGSIAVAQWSVSPDGRVLAYTTAAGGSDLQDIHLRDLRTGHDLAEIVPRVKFTGVSWTRDGKGFYYARFRGSVERANLQAANTHHQLFYHPLGGGRRPPPLTARRR